MQIKDLKKLPQFIIVLLKIISKIGYIILLFLETLFFPLQNLRESFKVTKQENLVDYTSKALSSITKEKKVKIPRKQKTKKSKKTKKNNQNKIKLALIGLLKNPIKINFPKPKVRKAKDTKKKQKKDWVPRYKAVRKRKEKKQRRFAFGFKMFILGIIFTLLFGVFPVVVYSWFTALPNPDLLVTKEVPVPTRILDRKGRLLFEVFVDKRYEPVKLDKIPQHVIDATIAVEDDDFYKHIGFDITSIIRAARATLVEDKLQGGSTITQQLIKNVLLTPEQTISRKVKEIVLSVIVEATYTKEQILEMYLNNISYGGTAWGIQSASQKFFGKNVWELTLAEASLLAGLPTAPSAYSPLTGDTTIAKSRQRYVLDRMYSQSYINEKQLKEAFDEPLTYVPQTQYIRAPHFVAFVREKLEEEYGRRFVEFGGLTVQTSLDLDIQEEVQRIVAEEVANNASLNISNGAAVVLDPQTGQIIAYVGSVDYFKDEWGAFDVANGSRQPGSSIKPVTYALALENGYTAASIIRDSPVSYRIPGQKPYTPKNYDGKYHGNVTLRSALANSYNIPAVRLASKLGPDNIVQLGKDMGLSNWEVDGNYGLSVTLGGKEVSLLELVNAYSVFAREGKLISPTPFMSISDKNGYEINEKESLEDAKQVISPETSYIIWHILSDTNARLPAFGTRNFLTIPNKTVAVKTGTTDEIRDNYTIGFTPSYAVGVWVGNNDNTPLNNRLASGISGAAPMWNKIMSEVLKDTPDEKMDRPDGVFVKYDERCNRSEVFKKGEPVPSTLCPEKDDDDKDNDDEDKRKDD